MPEPARLFYSYAHTDKTLRVELGKHLTALRLSGCCVDWHDGEILPGASWDDEIKDKLNSADFVLLLVSADFLASYYVRTVEMEIAMRRHLAKPQQTAIIPIMVRECSYQRLPFAQFQGLPTAMKAVTSWPNQDEAWADVARGIDRVVDAFLTRQSVPPPAPAPVVPPLEPAPVVTSAPPPVVPAQATNRALAASSTRAFQELRGMMSNATVRSIVAEHQAELEAAGAALQVLVDFKNLHDLLHDLQFKCYNYLLQEARKLERSIDWKILVQPQKDLRAITAGLVQLATLDSLQEEDFAWLEDLQKARTAFDLAATKIQLDPLKEARDRIQPILAMRPTIFDTKLCAAARTCHSGSWNSRSPPSAAS